MGTTIPSFWRSYSGESKSAWWWLPFQPFIAGCLLRRQIQPTTDALVSDRGRCECADAFARRFKNSWYASLRYPDARCSASPRSASSVVASMRQHPSVSGSRNPPRPLQGEAGEAGRRQSVLHQARLVGRRLTIKDLRSCIWTHGQGVGRTCQLRSRDARTESGRHRSRSGRGRIVPGTRAAHLVWRQGSLRGEHRVLRVGAQEKQGYPNGCHGRGSSLDQGPCSRGQPSSTSSMCYAPWTVQASMPIAGTPPFHQATLLSNRSLRAADRSRLAANKRIHTASCSKSPSDSSGTTRAGPAPRTGATRSSGNVKPYEKFQDDRTSLGRHRTLPHREQARSASSRTTRSVSSSVEPSPRREYCLKIPPAC